MPQADWTFLTTPDGLSSVAEQASTIIVGAKSLKLTIGINSGAMVAINSGGTVTTGKIRTLYRVSGTPNDAGFGFFYLMQTSIGVTAAAHWSGITISSGSAAGFCRRAQALTALEFVPGANQVGSTITTPVSGGLMADTVYAMSTQFQRDPNTGNYVITMWHDPTAVGSPATYNFATLEATYPQISAVTSTSPPSTSVGMGFGAASSTTAFNVFIDTTEIYV